MASRQFKIRGLRGGIPGGYVLGRTANGKGDAQLISLGDLGQSIVSVMAASGGSGGGPVSSVVAGTGIGVSVSGSAYTVALSTPITVPAAPVADTDAVNFEALLCNQFKTVCGQATAAALPSCTYANGSSGVGATLTATANGALSIDGATVVVGNTVLVKNQAAGLQNGIYIVTQVGDGSHPFILTRVSWYDNSTAVTGSTIWTEEVKNGDTIPVSSGTDNGDTIWMLTSSGSGGGGLFVIGTDTLTFQKVGGTSLIAAGTGISVSGNTVSLAAIAQHTFLGNNTGSTAAPTALTATQATAELNALVGDSGSGGTKGLAPAPAAGDSAAGKFLKADGTYAVPSGTGVAGATALFAPVMTAKPTNASVGFTTWVNQGSATTADNVVGLTVKLPTTGSTDHFSLRTMTAPSTPYTLTALVAVSYSGGGIGGALLGWYDGTNKFQGIRLISQSAFYETFVSDYASPTSLTTNHVSAPGGPLQWLQISDDGTTVTFSTSADGVNFSPAYSIAKASGFLGATGYSNVCFGVEAASADCYGTIMSWAKT